MYSFKRLLCLILLFVPFFGFTQGINANLFLRTPQVVNYNFNQEQVDYSPVVSMGIGLSHSSKFIELATFISNDEVYGYYTFFGKTLKTKTLGNGLNLYTNWFGEVTFVPKQLMNSNRFTYTSGLCYFLNYAFEWGSVGIPLCMGVAYSHKTVSLNTRAILNLSLNL